MSAVAAYAVAVAERQEARRKVEVAEETMRGLVDEVRETLREMPGMAASCELLTGRTVVLALGDNDEIEALVQR